MVTFDKTINLRVDIKAQIITVMMYGLVASRKGRIS